MCGIFAVFHHGGDMQKFRPRAVALSKKIRHRGPDWSGCIVAGNNIFCHERLAIVGIESGAQPLTSQDENVILAVNGEIYNHKSLKRLLKKKDRLFKTHSDCEILLHLYDEMGADFVGHLDGMYSFVLYDKKKDLIVAARDHVGITTLYYGIKSSDGSLWFSSEMKSLNEDCDIIQSFPPGHVYCAKSGSKHTRDTFAQSVKEYYHPEWYDHPAKSLPPVSKESDKLSPKTQKDVLTKVRGALEKSVKKRLMTEVPYGVLLSGGLDSSLIASIAMRMTKRIAEEMASKGGRGAHGGWGGESDFDEDEDTVEAMNLASSWPRLHSFSIGLPGSPDSAAAQKVADFLGTAHHPCTFSFAEGLDAIAEVVYHLETYDVTTIRASTPMYLLSRKIKAMGVKMVLSGEGADEIFGGYLYFHAAPSAQALHHECITRIQNLHTSDCLRANKSTLAWGLEARVPFLDKAFLDVAMTEVPANLKTIRKAPYNVGLEKWVLRKAFDVEEGEEPYLPKEILWRQKEQFSDGVGYSWIDGLKAHAEKVVSDDRLAKAGTRWSVDTPTTKEAYWYREVFEVHFPQKACVESVVRWIPRKDWGCPEDPSGRAQGAHNAAYQPTEANGHAANGEAKKRSGKEESPSPAAAAKKVKA